MNNILTHEIELYSSESFKTLLDHEVNRSRRYQQPLTLVHIAIEADPDSPPAQHSAEVFAINILNLQLRETDIPCKRGNEFIVLLPSTDDEGGRIACDRLEELFKGNPQPFDRVSFTLSAYIGMTSAIANKPISGNTLMQQADTAMQHARNRRLASTVLFSEIT
ncbi:MAG: diguanylate cyclase [Anaerolineae bacterium]|nr:diguanylate cyclase [Anaerolineae bacterium]MCI0609267.1 diguanylate cyclase [Anaerolineae bacterium]